MKKIYVDGTFDLLHVGHIQFLKKAKSFGDYLIVGVISGNNVESYKRQPIIPLEDRCTMLTNLKLVDEVIPNCPLGKITKDFIDKYKIDYVVYAGDPKSWNEHYKVPIEQKKMIYLDYNCNNPSTTKILIEILNRKNLNILT